MATHAEMIQAGRDFYEIRNGLSFRLNPFESPLVLRLGVVKDQIKVIHEADCPQDGTSMEMPTDITFFDVVTRSALALNMSLYSDEVGIVEAAFVLAHKEKESKIAYARLAAQKRAAKEARRAVVIAQDRAFSNMTGVNV